MKSADVREGLLFGGIAGLIGVFPLASFASFGILCSLGFRRGVGALAVSSVLYFIFSLVVLVLINRSLADTLLGLCQFGLLFPGILLIIKKNSAFRTCVRLVLYSLVWFLIIGGIYAFLVFNPSLHDSLVEQLRIYLEKIIGSGLFKQDPVQILGAASLEELVRQTIYNAVNLSAAMVFLALAFIFWSGQFLEGILDGGPRKFSIRKFTVHESIIWFLIASLGFLSLSKFIGLEKWLFPVWNIVMVLGLLYGLQGVGIILYLLDLIKTPILIRGLVLVVIIVVLGFNVKNYVVLGVIPLLGLTENWIKYRTWKRRESNENHSE